MPKPTRSQRPARIRLSGWRRDTLRTSLWFVPSILVVGAIVLFAITYALDRAVDNDDFSLPSWVNTGGPDAARTILTAIAAAVITVVGVVFSITILALQLASTQFGPRMLRNFIRDFGTQLTLGTFVATFVFSVLALGSVANEPGGPFVPHISVTVALVLLFVDLGVLIYFIHHVATSIQVTEVVRGIARDLSEAIDRPRATTASTAGDGDDAHRRAACATVDPDVAEIPRGREWLPPGRRPHRASSTSRRGRTPSSRLAHRPGHFVVAGRPLAYVWPAERRARRSPASSTAPTPSDPHRTLRQDLQFAIDQLVEISLRALSPAVNDTFTALTCIDWLGDGLCKITATGLPERHLPRRRRQDPRHRGRAPLRARAEPGVRQDPPGRPRHAGGRHPPAREPRQDRRVHDARRAAPAHPPRGRHDPPRRRTRRSPSPTTAPTSIGRTTPCSRRSRPPTTSADRRRSIHVPEPLRPLSLALWPRQAANSAVKTRRPGVKAPLGLYQSPRSPAYNRSMSSESGELRTGAARRRRRLGRRHRGPARALRCDGRVPGRVPCHQRGARARPRRARGRAPRRSVGRCRLRDRRRGCVRLLLHPALLLVHDQQPRRPRDDDGPAGRRVSSSASSSSGPGGASCSPRPAAARSTASAVSPRSVRAAAGPAASSTSSARRSSRCSARGARGSSAPRSGPRSPASDTAACSFPPTRRAGGLPPGPRNEVELPVFGHGRADRTARARVPGRHDRRDHPARRPGAGGRARRPARRRARDRRRSSLTGERKP